MKYLTVIQLQRNFVLCLAVWLMSGTVTRPLSGDDRPNIIIVMVDDMGFSDIGCYGSEIPTPNLDALANGGVRFSQFYNTGRCCPTRASLLTGLTSHQAGIGWMTADQNQPGYRGRLSDSCVTIAEVLGDSGYFTAMTGKWHVGFNAGVTPASRGFDRSLNLPAGGLHYSNQTGSKGGTRMYLNGTEVDRNDPQFDPPWYGTDLWTRQGLHFVDEAVAADKPFFWYLAHVAPHFPCMAPETTVAKYRGNYMDGWDALRQERYQRQLDMGLIKSDWKLTPRPEEIPAWSTLQDEAKTRYDDMMAIYAAMVDHIDQSVGFLVSALEDRELLKNTLILFLSDNGGNAEAGVAGKYDGDHPGDAHSNVFIGKCWAHLSNTPFRKYKHYNHEGGIATPLIAHWPAAQADRPRQWVDTPAHVIDLMATCVDVAQANYPTERNGHPIASLEGVSLRPLITGDGELTSRVLYWEHEGNAAIRDDHLKLVRNGSQGEWELFNLAQDRTEQKDLSADRPRDVQRLKRMWQQWASSHQVLPKPTKSSKKKNQRKTQ
ncbi:MAG: arylsulfatase [Planctomycetota bacterium]